jgi:hypothetical protein
MPEPTSGAGGSTSSAGAAGSEDDSTSLPCPDVGTLDSYSTFDYLPNEPIMQKPAAFGCNVLDQEFYLTRFEVHRFEVDEPSIFVGAAAHSLVSNAWLEKYALRGDCGPKGNVTPAWAGVPDSYVQPSNNLVAFLDPGIYVTLVCTEGFYESVIEPPPPPPTNIDCANAQPLSQSQGGGPYVWFDETRVLEPARFYEVRLTEGIDRMVVNFASAQSWSPVILTLRNSAGISVATTAGETGELWHEHYLSMSPLTEGDYCLEVNVGYGAKYRMAFGAYNAADD